MWAWMLRVMVVRMGVKTSILIEMGQYWSSKGSGIQDNHESWNWPKNVVVLQPEYWNRNLSTYRAGMRIGENVRIVKMGDFGGLYEKSHLTGLRIKVISVVEDLKMGLEKT